MEGLWQKKWIIGLRSMKCSFHVCINRTEDSGSHCAAVENHFLLCFCIIWSNRKWWKKIESVRFFQTFEGRHEWSLHSEEKSSSKNVKKKEIVISLLKGCTKSLNCITRVYFWTLQPSGLIDVNTTIFRENFCPIT